MKQTDDWEKWLVRLRPQQAEGLRKLAEVRDLPCSLLVREAIAAFLKRENARPDGSTAL